MNSPTLDNEKHTLVAFLARYPRLVVLTGAGISIDSGIPAYRDAAGQWRTTNPIQHRDFIASASARRRYWARSWYGWPRIRDAQPNTAHHALAALEAAGQVNLLITQNVDGLHQRAGSRAVVDLHGRLDTVHCLTCDHRLARQQVQTALGTDNVFPELPLQNPRPDGDMDVDDKLVASLVLPRCKHCGGDLKPDVVFFGGNVPRPRVERCLQALQEADALLVVGSSLKVFSGFRFCREASRRGLPITIVNPGATRGDELATHLLRCAAGPLLTAAAASLGKASTPDVLLD